MILTADIKPLKRLSARIKDIAKKQIPYATKLALNNTAKRIHKREVNTMKQVFDRPTPWTLRGLRIGYATKKNLVARVGFTDNFGKGTGAGKYIGTQISGGVRPYKRFERALQHKGYLPSGWYAVPGQRARLNKYGNMSQGQIVQILTALDALPGRPTFRGVTIAQQKRSAAVKKIFGVSPLAARLGLRLPPGVYRRTRRGVRPLLIFVKGTPQYKKRLPFHEVAHKTYESYFGREFSKAFKHAMATARR